MQIALALCNAVVSEKGLWFTSVQYDCMTPLAQEGNPCKVRWLFQLSKVCFLVSVG